MSTREQPKLMSIRSSHSSIHNSNNWQPEVLQILRVRTITQQLRYAVHTPITCIYKNATQQVLLIRHVNVTINSFVTYSHISAAYRSRTSMIMSIHQGLSRISLFKQRI